MYSIYCLIFFPSLPLSLFLQTIEELKNKTAWLLSTRESVSGVGSIVVTQTQTRCLCRGKKCHKFSTPTTNRNMGWKDETILSKIWWSKIFTIREKWRRGGFLTKWQGLFKLTQLGHQFGSSVLPTEDFVSTTLHHMWPQTEINNEKQARHYAV